MLPVVEKFISDHPQTRPIIDIDGVLVVSREIAYDVLIRAEEIRGKKIFGWVRRDKPFSRLPKKADILRCR